MSNLKQVYEMVNSFPLGERGNWEQYFMEVALIVSTRSTCGSRRVGAVVIDSLDPGKRRVLSTGYNGNPPGMEHCSDGGCPRFEAKKKGLIQSGEYNEAATPCYAFHAEANCLFMMQRRGISTEGCIIFTTASPCRACAEKIHGAGIKKVYFLDGYPDTVSEEYFKLFGIELIKVEM
jgi:dCMP deaminase